ncbi:class I SAM-dependent methyltransferase [Leucobacter triazinivorans]|uniref:Methyltransferase domain-containing protein n=1 Tax=Leucobacter triazinivorans TaxID=1784719 RepID=A0A4P6KH70_9MICO|nr:class I SAM-dependent methyltransferase [Leucobacter triazinivorans]QBE49431.1 methyltransferase domain-containing protein [Leucobacter triazinivorans]
MSITVSKTGISIPVLSERVRSVDIFFGEDRVWSIDLLAPPALRKGEYAWPAPIVPYLVGATEVSLRDSGTGERIAEVQARFSDADTVTRVRDADGIPLAINKWGRLGKTLERGNSGVQLRILDRTEEVIAHLTQIGLRPFVVGGTLLGGVRDQSLLPHDDDADVAYLSEHTNPVDVAREGFEVGHILESLGYEIVRHSATHMQLYFRDEFGALDHYVDVFAAFFSEDGCINQPFHVRGRMRPDQMLPFSTVTIQGREFPAPADPESWLVINYDENWRTPIPGYRLATPIDTVRRFQNWFGSFHQSRDFWNDHYRLLGVDDDTLWRTGAEWILAQHESLRAPWLVDLGCGTGRLGAEFAALNASRKVIAADYSPYALERAAEQRCDRFSVHHVNLFRTQSLALPRQAGIDGPFDLIGNHLFESLGRHALNQGFRIARMALRSGGSAVATLYGRRDLNRPHGDPMGWAIAPAWFVERAAHFGLDAEIVKLKPRSEEKRRAPYGVRFSLAPDIRTATKPKENS